MKREKASFEKGNALANFSLLYPQGPGISLNGENTFLELSPAAAHDLRTRRHPHGLYIGSRTAKRNPGAFLSLASRLAGDLLSPGCAG